MDRTRPTFAYLCASLHTGSGPEVWQGVREEALARDVNVLAFPGGRLGATEDFEGVRNHLYSLPRPGGVDGVLSWASSLSGIQGDTDLAAFHRRFDELPLVTLSDPLEGKPCVRFDVRSGMASLVDHLVTVHGYRSFAFVRGPQAHHSAQDRYLAFRESLERHGLSCREELITSPRAWSQGTEAVAELLDRRGLVPGRDFSVVVAASDLLGFSILRDLQNRGYRVPSDTAVVGFNDSPEGRIANPPLTTVHLPFRHQAAEGLRRLVDQWSGHSSPADGLLGTSLVLRQSCGCRSRELERAGSTPGSLSFADLGFQPDEIQAWLVPLEAALEDSVAERRDRRFLYLLERVLERMASSRFPAALWQTVLSEFRRRLPRLDRGLEDLFGQARILVGEAAVREYSFHQWQRDRKAEDVRALTRSFQGAPNPAQLAEILSRRLPDLGFRSGWLVHSEPRETAGRSVVLGGFTEHGRVALPPGGLAFSGRSVVPPGLLPNRRWTLVVEPLYFRDQSLGYLVLEEAAVGPEVYEELRSAVSTAMKTALLLESLSVASEFRVCDPLALWGGSALERPEGWDRLPLCLADPRRPPRSPEGTRLGIEGGGLRSEGSAGDSRLWPWPTLGGEPGVLEGDLLVVLSEGPVDARRLAALEAATSLATQVLDPRVLPWESLASLRPALGFVDLEAAHEATVRLLNLLAADPGWQAVPFLVLPRKAAMPPVRTLRELFPVPRTAAGNRVLFVGTPPPGEAPPALTFDTAPAGLQAIPLLQQDRPDFVVVASGDQGFRGPDLVDFLSSDPPLATLPVLVLLDEVPRSEDWARLEASPRAAVQIRGLWTDQELVEYLERSLARREPPSLRVKKALEWLVAHHAQDVARWRLARDLSVSEDHLAREFRRELGLSPWDFLSRYRILRAQRALAVGNRSLAEVGRDVGYHDFSYFCRVFRRIAGTSPQKFRQAAKGAPASGLY